MNRAVPALLFAICSLTLGARELRIGQYAEEMRARVSGKIIEALQAKDSRVSVSGTVTFSGREFFFLQKDDDGLKVQAKGVLPAAGEEVEVEGSPTLEGGRIALAAKSWKSCGRGEVPSARKVTSEDLVDGETGGVNWLRVTAEGRAIGRTENGLAVKIDGVPVNVMVTPLPQNLSDCDRTHPIVRLTGVAELMLDPSAFLSSGEGYVMGVKINVQNPDDIELVPDLAYLSARRDKRFEAAVVAVVALLVVGVIVFAVVIFRQRRRLFRTRTIMAERRRMADDIHDTIEQHLVGAGMLLKVNRIAEAQEVLVRAKREIRDIVWGLKNDDMMRLSPADMLRKMAHEENTKGIYRVDTRFEGLPEHLDAAAMRDLSLIVRETIGNAVKHGGAKRIAMSSDALEGGGWQLRVSNDGVPFDPKTAPGAKEGHFGIEGMKQRARRLGATVSIERRGKGMVLVLERRIMV